MKRIACWCVLVVVAACPVFAQGHADVVAQTKATLQANGVNLSGPCGAFEIVKRVAWQLRAEHTGLLSKPAGNNCQGYAVDIIAYPTGQIFDVLIGAGDENGPAWNEGDPVDPARWRPPFDPGDVPPPGQDDPPCPPCPTCPPCPSPVVDLSEVLTRLDRLDAGHALVAVDVKGIRTSLEEHRAAVREGKDTVLRWLTDWKSYLAIAAGILAGVGLGQ